MVSAGLSKGFIELTSLVSPPEVTQISLLCLLRSLEHCFGCLPRLVAFLPDRSMPSIKSAAIAFLPVLICLGLVGWHDPVMFLAPSYTDPEPTACESIQPHSCRLCLEPIVMNEVLESCPGPSMPVHNPPVYMARANPTRSRRQQCRLGLPVLHGTNILISAWPQLLQRTPLSPHFLTTQPQISGAVLAPKCALLVQTERQPRRCLSTLGPTCRSL